MVHDGPLEEPLPVSSLNGMSGCSVPGTGAVSVMKASIAILTDEVLRAREDEDGWSCLILRC